MRACAQGSVSDAARQLQASAIVDLPGTNVIAEFSSSASSRASHTVHVREMSNGQYVASWWSGTGRMARPSFGILQNMCEPHITKSGPRMSATRLRMAGFEAMSQIVRAFKWKDCTE